MATVNTGTRGTKLVTGTENVNVRDVSERILLLQPNAAPLISYQAGMGAKKVAFNPTFEWLQDELSPNTVTDSGGSGTGTTINLTTNEGGYVRPNDVLIAPNGESIHVTSKSTDALTVQRSMGSVAADDIATGEQFVIIGQAVQEGSDIPSYRHTEQVTKTGYIQIFKDPVILTEIQNATKSYGGPDRTKKRMLAAIEHKRSIEQAFLFGDAFEQTSGTQTLRGTGGLINEISTNVLAAGGVLSESDFTDSFLGDVFRYQPEIPLDTKLAFFSPILIAAINSWAKGALRITSNEKSFGVKIGTYVSAHGELKIIRHWLLKDFTEFQKYGFVVDPQFTSYRFMDGLDTKLHVNTQADSVSSIQDEYRTACGHQLGLEKAHGVISGVTGYAA